jgi:hypothetical protein
MLRGHMSIKIADVALVVMSGALLLAAVGLVVAIVS